MNFYKAQYEQKFVFFRNSVSFGIIICEGSFVSDNMVAPLERNNSCNYIVNKSEDIT